MARVPLRHWLIVLAVTSFVLGLLATAFVSWAGHAWWAVLVLGIALRAGPGLWLASWSYSERKQLKVKRPWLFTLAIVGLTLLAIARPVAQLALGSIETSGHIERSERTQVYLRGQGSIGGGWWKGFRLTVRTDAGAVVVLERSGPEVSRCHELFTQGDNPRIQDRTLRWYLNQRQTISVSCQGRR